MTEAILGWFLKMLPEHLDKSGGNEAKIVELNDGTLLMAGRPGGVFRRYIGKVYR